MLRNVADEQVARLYDPYAEAKKPYVVWVDYGTDGWKPTGYATLEEAVKAQKHMPDWIIMKSVSYKVVEE